MDERHADAVRLLAAGQGHILLGSLLKTGEVPRNLTVVVCTEGWGVRLTLYPAEEGEDARCRSVNERRILALLRSPGAPMSAKEIRRRLHAQKFTVSLSTVKRTLRELRRAQRVGNRRKTPAGYFALDHAPLFEQEPSTRM